MLPSREVETFAAALAAPERAEAFQRQLERMAVDTGDDRRVAGWPRDVVLEQRAVDRLLAEDWWQHPAEVLGSDEWIENDYVPLIRICAARRLRGEGDAERLAEVEEKLRAAAAGRAA